jgi:acetoin utilization protein AcuB
MFVRDRMSSPAVVVPPNATKSSALAFMDKRKIRRLPVVQDGKLLGIVTRTDLLRHSKKSATGALPTVAAAMTRRPVTVQADDTLEAAAQLMLLRKVSGLPVLDGNRVIGMLTESDLFRALCEILGVGVRGARVVMNVDDKDDLLEAIRGRMKHLSLHSLFTTHDMRRGAWDVVLRVRGQSNTSA